MPDEGAHESVTLPNVFNSSADRIFCGGLYGAYPGRRSGCEHFHVYSRAGDSHFDSRTRTNLNADTDSYFDSTTNGYCDFGADRHSHSNSGAGRYAHAKASA